MFKQDFKTYKTALNILKEVYPLIWNSRASVFVLRTRISLGRIALKEKNEKQSKRILNLLKIAVFENNTSFYNHYEMVLYLGFLAEYKIYNRDYENALKDINHALDLVLNIDFHLFTKMLYQLKIFVLRALHSTDLLDETLQDFENFKQNKLEVMNEL